MQDAVQDGALEVVELILEEDADVAVREPVHEALEVMTVGVEVVVEVVVVETSAVASCGPRAVQWVSSRIASTARLSAARRASATTSTARHAVGGSSRRANRTVCHTVEGELAESGSASGVITPSTALIDMKKAVAHRLASSHPGWHGASNRARHSRGGPGDGTPDHVLQYILQATEKVDQAQPSVRSIRAATFQPFTTDASRGIPPFPKHVFMEAQKIFKNAVFF